MQAVHLQNPMPQPSRIHPSRIWRVTVAVMFGHLVVAWWISSGVLTRVVPASEPDNVIMASVVMDAPAPPAPKPEPARPPIQHQTKPEPKPQTVAKPISTQVQPAPVLTPTAPSNAAPIVSNAAPALTPAAPATPTATPAGNQRPAANATATAVVLPSTSADYLNNPAPPYPRQSKRLGEEGTVVIRVLITAEGRAEKAEIRTSSGHARLDDTALTTVKAWRFVPGKRNGLPEAMWFNVPIRFVLD
ncbi:energy transducer TonB [uncultured Limnohabitans sp.]|uniref:energy transducer TonB n=1 Tax=uncultured Limnohabitans sp. TaxID=768543 RepID=UPI002610C05E|nr:energy transducer TonB [uncultured Limnohabitans sp.]